ncbi:MAG TPA: glycosyltransferase 61 family protein [Caulobacteraceae bacterium]|jgi:capsular polysaccharide biosynthesis protein|nr:glycosyltransferase 61 family protein [Caulobacteraceae bacterium]
MVRTPLQVVAERTVLAELSPGDLAAPPRAPGGWAQVEGADYIPPEILGPKLEGRLGGGPIPDWAEGAPGAFRGDTTVCRVPDVWLLPRFGAVIDDTGRVFASTVGESLSWNPDLAALPFVERAGEARLFSPPVDAPRLAGAAVFMAKGGEFNYGHFLLDCLPALLAVEELGLTAESAPVAPPLKPWSRELLALAFPDLVVRETRARAVRLGEAVFSTAMDHYLHRPNVLLSRLRERIEAQSPAAGGGPRRVYISRRAWPMRVMVDEPVLEAALAARGFVIARAERLSVAEQIALVRDAEVVVGPTGAGLANALFVQPGARVIEIQPEIFTSWWLRDLVHLIGADWHGYFCPAPTDPGEVAWRYRIRRGFRWGYRLGTEGFLRFLDERL